MSRITSYGPPVDTTASANTTSINPTMRSPRWSINPSINPSINNVSIGNSPNYNLWNNPPSYDLIQLQEDIMEIKRTLAFIIEELLERKIKDE